MNEVILANIKEFSITDKMNKRIEASEKAISSGKTKTFDQFNSDFENWKARKREAMR